MDGLISDQLSIIAWGGIGKPEIERAIPALNALCAPTELGAAWPTFFDVDQVAAFFSTHAAFAVVEVPTSELAGGFGLREDCGVVWFYYFLMPHRRGQGLAASLIASIVEIASSRWPGEYILARCALTNEPSMRALRKAGFAIQNLGPTTSASIAILRAGN